MGCQKWVAKRQMGAIFIRKNVTEGTKKPEVLGDKRVFTLWIFRVSVEWQPKYRIFAFAIFR
jgi:hypothetical protein